MEIFDLFCFLSLVKCQHFYEAAEELYISQSALSRNIQSLEKELNVKLFLRKTNGSVLTDAGKAFLPYAQNITSEYQRMQSTIARCKAPSEKALTVYTFSYLVAYNVQSMLDAFAKENPDIPLIVLELDSNTCYNSLANNDNSVAIAFSNNVTSEKTYSAELFSDSLSAVVSENSELSKFEELSMKDLIGHRVQIISNVHEKLLNDYLSDICSRADIPLDNKSALWYTTLGNAATRYDLVALMPTSITGLIFDSNLKKINVSDGGNFKISISANISEDGTIYEPAKKLIDFALDYFSSEKA